jgi:L-glyceraldehyde 3-phosphate reductase
MVQFHNIYLHKEDFMNVYSAKDDRYEKMKYRRCGKSGLLLSEISLGFWHNFGSGDKEDNCRQIMRTAFDAGVTHFDLANNYGPPPGSAEETFGRILKKDFSHYRDELIISSKAGYGMWDGPYGDWGSRKYLISSCDQSLKRMGLDYVDIFYHHRPDPSTPLEETMAALDHIVRSGKALYAGISNYSAEQTSQAVKILKELGTPCLIHQASYSMLNRWTEDGLLSVLGEAGVGCICFSPLAQGLLTNRYLDGHVPEGSRASKKIFLKPEHLTEELLKKLRALQDLALANGRTLARMAIKWILRDERNTSVLLGASSPEQMKENLLSVQDAPLSKEEIHAVEEILRN